MKTLKSLQEEILEAERAIYHGRQRLRQDSVQLRQTMLGQLKVVAVVALAGTAVGWLLFPKRVRPLALLKRATTLAMPVVMKSGLGTSLINRLVALASGIVLPLLLSKGRFVSPADPPEGANPPRD
ncbi:MAG: hypothetical protein KGL90_00400 [Burkholderiales bacterium]|nr:hypothetical protein [Burkholderiales bacterium]